MKLLAPYVLGRMMQPLAPTVPLLSTLRDFTYWLGFIVRAMFVSHAHDGRDLELCTATMTRRILHVQDHAHLCDHLPRRGEGRLRDEEHLHSRALRSQG